MTYAANLTSVICNISRVVKPGAKISLLDGVAKDAYDRSNPEHRRLLIGTREVTGFGALYHYSAWNKAVEDCGMRVLSSRSEPRRQAGPTDPAGVQAFLRGQVLR